MGWGRGGKVTNNNNNVMTMAGCFDFMYILMTVVWFVLLISYRVVYDIFNFLFEIGGEGEGGIFHVIQTRHELNYSIMFCVFFIENCFKREKEIPIHIRT